MTYSSGEPAPMTPETKLANRNWRLKNSWWVLVPVLSCSFLCWLGFLTAAIRTGERKYWIPTAIYSTLFVAFLTLAVLADGDTDSLANTLAIIPFLVCWVGATIHAAILNRGYLRTLAAKGAWYQAPATATHPSANTAVQPQPFLGVSSDSYYAPTSTNTPINNAAPSPAPTAAAYPPPPPQPTAPTSRPTTTQASGPQPVNSATTESLAQIPGISPALAQRIVAVRDARGGYRDIDDLTAAANLQPHEVVRLRNNLTFGDSATSQPQHNNPSRHGSTGRILDI